VRLPSKRNALSLNYGCLEYCIVNEVDRTTYECSPMFRPPIEGCDLPWDIDARFPTSDPYGDGMHCIPEELELAGYHLFSDRGVYRQVWHHESNCTTVLVSETLIQRLSPASPPRPCPDPGAWTQAQESITSIYFVECP